MQVDFRKILIGLLVIIAFVGFLGGIAQAILYSFKPPPIVEIPAFISGFVISVSAVLATNLGAMLGFSIGRGTSLNLSVKHFNPFSGDVEALQKAASLLYILALFVCALFWGIRFGFETVDAKNQKIVCEIVPQMTKSLVGVVVAALTFALAKKP